MMSLIGGLIALILGIVFLVFWFPEFYKVLMGTLPALFVLGGALAVYLGIEEIKDKSASDSFDDETSELKNEVESLKEEIKGLIRTFNLYVKMPESQYDKIGVAERFNEEGNRMFKELSKVFFEKYFN